MFCLFHDNEVQVTFGPGELTQWSTDVSVGYNWWEVHKEAF